MKFNAFSASNTNEVPSPWRHKFNCLEIAIDFVVANNIIGDYLEFGVFSGTSFVHAYHSYVKRFAKYKANQTTFPDNSFLHQSTRFFAFDSFEGLPQVFDPDIPLHWRGPNVMKCEKSSFIDKLIFAGIDMNSVKIIEGYYENSLHYGVYDQMGLERAAVIHIDCGLYDSTRTVLKFITPLIQDGTVIVFDDFFYYKGHPLKGERGAFNEWLNQHQQFHATELCKYYPAAAYIINQL